MALAALQTPPTLTLTEWADLDEDEPGELVDGQLEEEEMPNFLHEVIVSWLVRTLGGWARPRGGWVFGSEAKYAVAARRGRKPDVTVFFPGTPRPRGRDSLSHTPPSIAVEVVSAGSRDERRDRIDKFAEYAQFGVPFYWIIDPRLRTLEVFERGADGRYTRALAATTGSHDAPGCAELVIDLDALWAEAAPWLENEDEPSSER